MGQFPSRERESSRIREAAQPYVDEVILAAAMFAPNARYFGGGLMQIASLWTEQRAIRAGGLQSQTLWALTPSKLFILDAKWKLLKGRPLVRGVLKEWDRSEFRAERVQERGGIKGHPSFAIKVTHISGETVEMQAFVHSNDAHRLIEDLVT